MHDYWARQGCVIQQPCDIEVGAGTFNPATFLRVLGPEPWRVAYVEPSRRPTDSRYGENPSRTGHYYQYQVILKPSPPDIQDIYLKSLEHLGIDLKKHDVRFVEDDWESPTLGASGLGWEVWLDGAEITQYTYFQQMGSLELDPISIEITYGLERITLDLQDVDSCFDIEWVSGVSYGDVHHRSEVEFSKYYHEEADTAMLFQLFDIYEKEALACFDKGLVLPAVDYVLKCSHAFNVLDARGSISVTERVSYIARVRNLARRCAQGYYEQREEMGYPLLKVPYPEACAANPDSSAMPASSIQHSDLLLEIGTEEIPASYIQPALKQMEKLISKSLGDNRLEFKSVRTIGTPRRLVLSVESVSTHQPDRTVEVMGPPKRIAFDQEGNPTKAAEGFARKVGADVGDLKIKETERGEYVYFLQQELGKSAIAILSEELPKLISSLGFPKSMRFSSFEDGRFQFARPVRWIVALLGEDLINFSVGRVKSGRTTIGHRFLSDGFIELADASLDSFEESLKEAGVVTDHDERKGLIREQVTRILESEGCPVHIDEELLDTVTFLVEMPKAIVGTFNENYLSLPVEVLETAMKKHQRYFSLRTGDSSEVALLPKFITITNGVGDEGIVRHGNERVLRARLADAEFFYKEDQKSRLVDGIDKLKHVVFQEELGSLYDKAQRLKELAVFICEELGLEDGISDNAVRAAELCKVDLTTQMVIEFPSLQGIMGGYYAANSEEAGEVSEAIRSHYYPTSPGGTLPESIIGSIVSIADKLDTIVGYFGIGSIPSGSRDPYALRRQAMGIVRILFESKLHLALDRVVGKSISLYSQFPEPDGTKDTVLEFLKGRVAALLSDRDSAYDVIDSVLAVGFADIPNVVERAYSLSMLRELPDFEKIYNAFNRVIRILPKDEQGTAEWHGEKEEIDKGFLQDQAEKHLYEAIVSIEEDVRQSAADGDYDGVLDKLVNLRSFIDTFFDEVLVMAEQDDLRNNRLMLLKRLDGMFSLVADFSKLVE